MRIENPQAGCSGVPFMKSITGFSSIACWRKARISSLVMSAPGCRGLDRKRVDGPADLVAEDRVDELVLLDPREAIEAVRDDLGPEVIAAAGQVLYRGCRSWKCPLDALSELFCGRHCFRNDSGVSRR